MVDHESPCLKCGKALPFTIPFVMHGFRGYQQEVHECGPEFQQAVFVSGDKEFNRKIGEMFKAGGTP